MKTPCCLIVAVLVVISCLSGANCAYADTIQVTFTGQISDNIYPIEYAFAPGDSFSAVLTYDNTQPDLGSGPNTGLYGDYSFVVTVQSSVLGGPVSYGGPISWSSPTCAGCADDPLDVYYNELDSVPYVGVIPIDEVGEGATVGFSLPDYSDTAVSDDSLADVNWQSLFAASQAASQALNVQQTDRAKIAFRAPNAADVSEGAINAVSVQDIPTPTPEPSSLVLLVIGLVGVIAVKGKNAGCTRGHRKISHTSSFS